jgi:hypothetical protein
MEDAMAKPTLEAKTLPPSRQAGQRERAEALIADRTRDLFERLTPLLGFSFDEELSAVEVELQRWPGHAWSREVYDELESLITDFAVELAAEDPQGAELLRGRTFARNLH